MAKKKGGAKKKAGTKKAKGAQEEEVGPEAQRRRRWAISSGSRTRSGGSRIGCLPDLPDLCPNLTTDPPDLPDLCLPDLVPVLDEMLRRAPGERLRGERRVARAARAHHRRAEDAEVRHLVREAPAVDDVGLGGCRPCACRRRRASTRPSGRRPARAGPRSRRPPRYHCSILSWMNAPILRSLSLYSAVIAADRIAERILHHRIEVEEVVLVRQRRLLEVGGVRAVGVLLDERLPRRAPGRRLAERAHAGGADRAAVRRRPTGCRRR